MKKPNPSDIPDFISDLLGFKTPKDEDLTEEQKFGKKLLEIAKEHQK